MAVPITSAGLKSIQDEFGGDTLDGGISLTEYYKGGAYVPIGQTPSMYSKGTLPIEPNYYWVNPIDPPPPPVYSEISIGNFLGMEKALEINILISQNLLTGFNLHNHITSNYPTWNSSVKVKATVTINSGVYVIGANTDTSTYAFDASFNFAIGSTLKIINNGVISGRGGNGGNGGSYPNLQPTEGGNGGNGLNVSGIETTIQNLGLIAGGAGGGAGGLSYIACFNQRYGQDTVTYFNHMGGHGGGGGVPLGLGGAGNNCGQLTTADFTNFNLGYFSYEGDATNDYYNMAFVAGVLGTSASLSNRGVGTTPVAGTLISGFWGAVTDSILATTSGDGGDYGMDGFTSELTLKSWATGYGDPNLAGMGIYGHAEVVNSTSGKFGGAGGNAITGGYNIVWQSYGTIRGDVDNWGYYTSKVSQPQSVSRYMNNPSYYISHTRKVAGWVDYGAYYPASVSVDNTGAWPSSLNVRTYRAFITNAGTEYLYLEGACDNQLQDIKIDGYSYDYSTYTKNPVNTGQWNITSNKQFTFDQVYKTSRITVAPGVHVIEIVIFNEPNTPHMFNIEVKNDYNSVFVNRNQWFMG